MVTAIQGKKGVSRSTDKLPQKRFCSPVITEEYFHKALKITLTAELVVKPYLKYHCPEACHSSLFPKTCHKDFIVLRRSLTASCIEQELQFTAQVLARTSPAAPVNKTADHRFLHSPYISDLDLALLRPSISMALLDNHHISWTFPCLQNKAESRAWEGIRPQLSSLRAAGSLTVLLWAVFGNLVTPGE